MSSQHPYKPTKADLERARNALVPDLIAPNLKVLFCGINPGLYSGATGLHFARPGNRFWPALHLGGFTDRRLTAADEAELLQRGYGITCVVRRATATAAELRDEEYVQGAQRLIKLVEQCQPRGVAFLGIGAYRTAFQRPMATVGPQAEPIGSARVWVLPNPSGLNAHYSLADLGRLFAACRLALEQSL